MTIKKQQKDKINIELNQIQAYEQHKLILSQQQKELFVHSFSDFLKQYPDIEQIFDEIEFSILENLGDDNEFLFESLNINFKKNFSINKDDKNIKKIEKDINRFTSVVALFISYIKKNDCGDIAKSHHKESIKIFWWGLFWIIVSSILTLVLIGIPMLAAVIIWLAYKIIKGLVKISEDKAYFE